MKSIYKLLYLLFKNAPNLLSNTNEKSNIYNCNLFLIYILKKEKGQYFNKKGIAEVKEYVKLKKKKLLVKDFAKEH